MSKELLRKSLRDSLRTLDSSDFKRLSLELSENLYNLLSQLDSQIIRKTGLKIGVFSPILKEPLWFLDKRSNKYSYLLVHMGEGRELSFHPASLDRISSGQYGLTLDDQVLAQIDTPDILLVPGLGFNEEKERIGRGKGFFDTYLQDFKGVSIGIFFEKQKVKNVYAEKHDQKLNYIVTETKIY